MFVLSYSTYHGTSLNKEILIVNMYLHSLKKICAILKIMVVFALPGSSVSCEVVAGVGLEIRLHKPGQKLNYKNKLYNLLVTKRLAAKGLRDKPLGYNTSIGCYCKGLRDKPLGYNTSRLLL